PEPDVVTASTGRMPRARAAHAVSNPHRALRAISILIGGRNDGHAIGSGHAHRDGCTGGRQFAEVVVLEQRQVRLPRDMVDHAEDTPGSVDIGGGAPPPASVAARG